MRIKRQLFLQQLEAVQPGLSARDVLPQSTCFVFYKGTLATFNDHVCCRLKCDLANDLTGAIVAKPLLEILKKLPDNEIEIAVEKKEGEDKAVEFVIKGAGGARRVGLRMEADITLPVKDVETPDKEAWKTLPEEFTEAVDIVSACTSKDDAQFIITCVHFHPKHLEASDDIRAIRFPIVTGLTESMIIPKDNLKHIIGMDMTRIAATPNWLHFRNPAGLRMSLRRYNEIFMNMDDVLVLEAGSKKMSLPGTLSEVVECAEVFSAENPESNEIKVELKEDTMRISGVGLSGNFREVKKVKYSGPPTSFMIPPKMLAELAKSHETCMLGATKIHVDTGRFVYISSIGE